MVGFTRLVTPVCGDPNGRCGHPGRVVVVLLGWDIRVLTGPSRLWLGIRLTLVAVCVLWLTRSVWVGRTAPA